MVRDYNRVKLETSYEDNVTSPERYWEQALYTTAAILFLTRASVDVFCFRFPRFLRPIDQLYFQISNCNVFVYVTLVYVFFKLSIKL